MKFHDNPSVGMELFHADGLTDRHEANSCFLQYFLMYIKVNQTLYSSWALCLLVPCVWVFTTILALGWQVFLLQSVVFY
jgi:hypothetical protein